MATGGGQSRGKLWANPGGAKEATHSATFIDALLIENEDVLHGNQVVLLWNSFAACIADPVRSKVWKTMRLAAYFVVGIENQNTIISIHQTDRWLHLQLAASRLIDDSVSHSLLEEVQFRFAHRAF